MPPHTPELEPDRNVNLTESDTETISFTSTVPDNSNEANRKSKLQKIFDGITIEPVMFCQMFATGSTGVIVQDMYIDRICRVLLNNTAATCANLTINQDDDTTALEREVDGYAGMYTLYRGLIETIVPILFAMFLGSFTDKHGSKFPLLLPIFGYILSQSCYTLFTFLPDLPPGYILFSSIPVSLTGGMVAIVLSAFSFISTQTTMENRSFRIAILEAIWFAGLPVGLFAGAKVFKATGFTPVFLIAGVMLGVALIYGLLFIHEEKQVPEIPDTLSTNICTDMFNIDAVKETILTVFARRDGPKRRWILLLIGCISLRIMTLFGPTNVSFLFVRYQFAWNEQTYTTYTILESVLGLVGGILTVVLAMKMLKLEDTLIGLLSCTGIIVANILVAISPRDPKADWLMYVAAILQMFSGMTSIMIRSLLSKIVPKQELAKVFTFVACAEASVPMIANALYTSIFINTEKNFAGAFSLLTAFLNSLVLFKFIYFHISMRKHSGLMQLDEDPLVEGMFN